MQQRGGGSQYGASPTEMTPFASAATDTGHSMLGGSSDHPQQQQLKLGDPSLAEAEAEAASPISSRPPATTAHSSAGNFEEPLPVPIPGGLPDEDMLAGEEVDRVGVAVGNRWPRQETLALLKIRSDMDATFRDATLKGPLWEDVSRKLADLGYKRSAKKCKEKFENVHKYYKRTKEGRAGRQDGKSYRFFSQLEALDGSNVSAATPTMPTSTKPTLTCVASSQQLVAAPLPVSIGIGIEVTNPMHAVSSISIPPPLVSAALPQAPAPSAIGVIFPSYLSAGIAPPSSGPATVAARPAAAAIGVCFTSDSSASSAGSEELDEDEEMEAAAAAIEGDLEGEQAGTSQRKRQRGSSKRVSSSSSQRMMEFFEGLMKQVIQKQEGMQQRFLETIEKREQDRMIREEAWKRQEMERLAREHELMAQERAMSASRDAAIIAFLQKITGQTVQLPQPVIIPAAPPPPPPTFPIPPSSSVPPPPPPPSEQRHHKTQQQQWQHYEQQPHHQQQQLQHHHHPQAAVELVKHHHPTISSEVVMAVPEQQVRPQEIRGSASFETSSSRWPKAEVLALIKLRSGLESRYQEAGPKGPLWEEISAGMQRMGYKRSAKRCKEKWENINKYFKKVKESNKKRPADAKTCPYFHQLDALYRKKIIGSSSGGGGSSVDGNQNRPEQQQQESGMMDPIPAISLQEMTDVSTIMPSSQTTELDNKGGVSSDLQTSNAGLTATLFGEGSCGGADTGAKKPEDIVKEQQQKQQTQQLLMMDCDKTDEPDNDIIDQEDDDEDDDDGDGDGDDDDDDQVEMNKMAYKIEFQRQNAGSSNGGGNGAPSFLAMVQ